MRVKGEGGGEELGMERRGIGSGDTLPFPICVPLSNLFIGLNQLLLPIFLK